MSGLASVLSGGLTASGRLWGLHDIWGSQERKYFVSGALNARSGAVKNLPQEYVLSAEMHEK